MASRVFGYQQVFRSPQAITLQWPSTAESREVLGLSSMYRHVWFGIIQVTPVLWRPRSLGMITISFPTTIFGPKSTPANEIYGLSLLIIGLAALIFVVVAALLTFALFKFKAHRTDENREPPQVYGSNQIELAWTVIPTLIVLVLFLGSSRVIGNIQRTQSPDDAINVTVVGHQFWWEFRYPGLNVVTANELHVPVSELAHPTPTYMTLLSADTDHSFWVPRLGGKTDLIPNHPNTMWIDPHETGLYLGQCAQYCGVEHAKMLLRVYVQSRPDFDP